MTIMELLIAAAMSVVIVGAAGSMLIAAVQDQPALTKRAQVVTTTRTALEKMTREIRNGFYVYPGASSTTVSFKTRLRRTTCGGAVPAASAPAIECEVTYTCGSTAPVTCTRAENAPGGATGTAMELVSGLQSSQVFNYSPNAEEAFYIGVTLQVANPEGNGNLTISDGAELRTLGLPR